MVSKFGEKNPEVSPLSIKQKRVPAQSNKYHLKKLIERSTQDLHHRVDMQQHLMLTILGEMKNECPVDLCSLMDFPHRKMLRQVLMETIKVLEETKKAFKSKRLEGLRKRLIDVLMETA
jgi:hypothetical protein